ncbi:MAG: hypothetical protein HUU20_02970 [Pirellulales bacterium]|nr:hypothetical protein [Pirellulales bacterium]
MPPIELTAIAPVKSCEKVSRLVNQLWQSVSAEPVLAAEVIDPGDIPEPYRTLLVHASDMTSTLTDYHGEPIKLDVVERVVGSGWLARCSILEVARTGRPVEFGVIRIDLSLLHEPVRRQVLEGRVPLGGLLNECGIGYRSCPGGFLRVKSNGTMNQAFHLPRPTWLYGRCNCLSDLAGRTIAEVVEILPP